MDPNKVRMSNLENRINNQEQKLDKILDQITVLLNEISKKTSAS
jgi:uncharacterized coiled-coil protein SlyX